MATSASNIDLSKINSDNNNNGINSSNDNNSDLNNTLVPNQVPSESKLT